MEKKRWSLKLNTSVYTSLELGNRIYVGASDWDRRKIKYSKDIAKKSKGILYLFKKDKSIEKKIIFPSMVYSIIKLDKKRIFVGCKSEIGTFNLFDLNGNLLNQKDDKVGGGVYDSIFNPLKKEIVCTTRSGILEILNSETLEIKEKINLSKNARIWPLIIKKRRMITGDYNGVLYIIDSRKIKKLDLKKFYKGDKRLKENFGPSIWGIESIKENIFVGTRWGHIVVFDKNLELINKILIGEDITSLKKKSSNILLVGTRYGKVYLLNIKNNNPSLILERKPVLQKENAIWSISRSKKGFLVNFADGEVIEVS